MIKIIWTAKDETELRLTQNGMKPAEAARLAPRIVAAPCELNTADGPYNDTGYRLERREDGFAVTVGLMEHISGLSAWEVLGWLNEKQAIPRRYDDDKRR